MNMSLLQKVLALLLVAEICATAAIRNRHAKAPRLPAVDVSQVDSLTASEIRDLERRVTTQNPGSWVDLADMYRAFGFFPQAEQCYHRAVGLDSANPDFLYRWGLCLDLMGGTERASDCYRKAAKLYAASGPSRQSWVAQCWLNIGQDRLREEKVAEAEAALREALELPRAKVVLSRVLLKTGRAAEAGRLLDQIIQASPDMVEVNELKSRAEAGQNHPHRAAYFAERSLRSQGQISKWDPFYNQISELRRKTGSERLFQSCMQLESRGELAQALAACRQAIDLFWTEDRAQRLARLQIETGDTTNAIATARDCIRRVGASAAILDALGVALVKSGDQAGALQAWREAAEIEPTPDLFGKLAEMNRTAGNAAEQRRYLSLREYQIGKMAWLKNDLASAEEHLQRAAGIGGADAHTWFYLGETLRFLEKKEAAKDAYEHCLSLNPDHGRALRGLQRLKEGNVD